MTMTISMLTDHGERVTVDRPSDCRDMVGIFLGGNLIVARRDGSKTEGRLLALQGWTQQWEAETAYYTVQWPSGYEGSVPDADLIVTGCRETWRNPQIA